MKLPQLKDPTRYAGLYVVDFGNQTAVGYTAREVELLLDHEAYRHCRVYKIHRAQPDGTLELKGVDHKRFLLEEGLFFHRQDEAAARADFQELRRLAEEVTPPCRAKLRLARLEADQPGFVTVLIYPSEYSDEISRWLLDAEYAGGDYAEGGASHVTDFYQTAHTILAAHQIWGSEDGISRSVEEVLAATSRAVQR
jgi:hypothetical protein